MAISKVGIWNMALHRVGETELVEDENEATPAAEACRVHWDRIVLEMFEAAEWSWAFKQASVASIGTQTQTTSGDGSKTAFSITAKWTNNANLTVYLVDSGGTETEQTAGTDYTITQPADGSRGYVTMTSAPAADESIKTTVATSRIGWEYVYALPADCRKVTAVLAGDMRHRQIPAVSRQAFDVVLDESGESLMLVTDVKEADLDAVEYVAEIGVAAWPGTFVSATAWKLAVELAGALPKLQGRSAFCEQRFAVAFSSAVAWAHDQGHESREPTTPSLLARDNDVDSLGTSSQFRSW